MCICTWQYQITTSKIHILSHALTHSLNHICTHRQRRCRAQGSNRHTKAPGPPPPPPVPVTKPVQKLNYSLQRFSVHKIRVDLHNSFAVTSTRMHPYIYMCVSVRARARVCASFCKHYTHVDTETTNVLPRIRRSLRRCRPVAWLAPPPGSA
jgi:hypothetical protein